MELQESDARSLLTDQHFLLDFILSNYVGPDVVFDNPRRSGSQRIAEGLQPYTPDDLGPSFVSISQLENLYHYILRNAHPSLILKHNLFKMYVRGNLLLPNSGLSDECEQFTSHFPSTLHERTSYPGSFDVVKGIVLIDNPSTSYGEQERLEKFKCLSGINVLKIDADDFLHYHHDQLKDSGETISGHMSNGEIYSPENDQDETRKKRRSNSWQSHVPPCLQSHNLGYPTAWSWNRPSIMPLLCLPRLQEHISNASIILTGTARKGRPGPPIGVVNIGVSKATYFFQVALPGVGKDNCQLSCEVECEGRVQIQGLSESGEGTIRKHSHFYHMEHHQVCPPGPFTLSFSLPGPVDPRLFSAKYRDDGILEAVIVKFGVAP